MSALGFADEVIKQITLRRPFFQMVGLKKSDFMQWRAFDTSFAEALKKAEKFSLPPLGQFYRPLQDLHSDNEARFDLYALDYEIDMVLYPPYEEFVLEFEGQSDTVQITSVIPEPKITKYVLYCRQTEFGVAMFPYYYNSQPLNYPQGWLSMGTFVELRYQPPEERVPSACKNGNAIPCSVLRSWAPIDLANDMVTCMGPEIRALYQFLVVLKARNGITRSQSTSKKKMDAKTGRYFGGYRYHILDIHTDYVVRDEESEQRDRSQITTPSGRKPPGKHRRRGHLRWYDNRTWCTLVKQTWAGHIEYGLIEKDYRVK